MFREKYKKENEIIEPHPVIMDDLSAKMKAVAAENRAPKRCPFSFKVAAVFAVAIAVTVTGMLGSNPFGTNSISALPEQPEISVNATATAKYQKIPFALVAYAAEGTENGDVAATEKADIPTEKTKTEIKPNAKVQIPKIRIESASLSSDAHYIMLLCDLTSAFVCQGEGITSVKYTAKTGSISNSFSDIAKSIRSSDEFKEYTAKPNEPVSWYPTGAMEDLVKHSEKNQDYSLLIGDVITITATYETGETQTQTLHLSFDKGGNLFAERKG